MMKCSVENCENAPSRKGMCNLHYRRFLKHGDVNYRSRRPSNMVCEVIDCGKDARALGLCNKHYHRHLSGKPIGGAALLRRQQGSGTIHKGGYIELMVAGEKVLEHRLIAEKALGKKLPLKAIVHHVNGNPADNRNCNLVVCPDQSYHMLLHLRQKELNYNGTAL